MNCANGIRVFGQEHRIINNLFLDCAGAGVVFEVGHLRGRSHGAPAATCLVAHNTIVRTGGGIVAARQTERDDWRPRDNHIVNNIIAPSGGALIASDGHESPLIEHNLLDLAPDTEIGQRGRYATVAAAKLTGVGLSTCPGPGSPALDAGTSLDQVPYDRNGTRRPQGPAPDIGADEYAPDQSVSLLDRLPEVPPERWWNIDLFKAAPIVSGDDDGFATAFSRTGRASVADGIVTLRRGDGQSRRAHLHPRVRRCPRSGLQPSLSLERRGRCQSDRDSHVPPP